MRLELSVCYSPSSNLRARGGHLSDICDRGGALIPNRPECSVLDCIVSRSVGDGDGVVHIYVEHHVNLGHAAWFRGDVREKKPLEEGLSLVCARSPLYISMNMSH